MKFNQVLVVYKQITSAAHGPSKANGQNLHLKTLDMLYPLLKDFGISFETSSTNQLRTVGNVDLVITVGGDGTALFTSHFLDNQPILAIKSYGPESVGYFCAATGETMGEYLAQLFSGGLKPILLNRLEVNLNGRVLDELALNDVLFAHALPASMAKYRLYIDNKDERQRSSGIWISSAAGSTAAVSAAGGKPLPLDSNKMEYIVREPYTIPAKYKLIGGIIPDSTPIKIMSLIQNGTVCIDGSHIQYPAPEGTEITVQGSKKPLNIYWSKRGISDK